MKVVPETRRARRFFFCISFSLYVSIKWIPQSNYDYGQNIWLWPDHMIMARTYDYGQNIWLWIKF